MNCFLSLWRLLPFLDQAPVTPSLPADAEPASIVVFILVLILLLIFVGYLLWSAIQNKRSK